MSKHIATHSLMWDELIPSNFTLEMSFNPSHIVGRPPWDLKIQTALVSEYIGPQCPLELSSYIPLGLYIGINGSYCCSF